MNEYNKSLIFPTKNSSYSPVVACLDLLDGEGFSAGGDGRENFAVLLNEEEGSIMQGVNDTTGARGSNVRESHGAKRGANIPLKLLDHPLSILLAKSVRRSDWLRDSLAGGQVLNDRRTRSCRGSSDGGRNDVTTTDGDAREIVGVVGVLLVKSCSMNRG